MIVKTVCSLTTMDGRAAAVANVIKEESSMLLFSIPKVTVSRYIVEFDREN